jgi:dihydrofolate reductase
VIMGRRTWDSLPPRFRPLSGRRNIVITRRPDWQAEGAERAESLQDALARCEAAQESEVWVIGGAQIYAEAEPLAKRALVTEIGRDYEGDTWAPRFDVSWRETARESHVSSNGLPYSFITLERPE